MTDQFYYNCLVPNASLLDDEKSVNEDVPPPRPPRPQRPFDASNLATTTNSRGPEIPPKLFGSNSAPIHKRQRSAPLISDQSETQSWAPQYNEDPFSDSENSPVMPPPWILDSANINNTSMESAFSQGYLKGSPNWKPPVFDYNQSVENGNPYTSSSSATSPLWQDSQRIQGYVLRGSDRSVYEKRNSVSEIDRSRYHTKRNHSSNEFLDRMPTYTKRNSVSEVERTSRGFLIDKSSLHDSGSFNVGYSKQPPELIHRSPGSDRNSRSGSVDLLTGSMTCQMSPEYEKLRQKTVSMESVSGHSQKSPRGLTIDNSMSFDYPQASPHVHEYDQVTSVHYLVFDDWYHRQYIVLTDNT